MTMVLCVSVVESFRNIFVHKEIGLKTVRHARDACIIMKITILGSLEIILTVLMTLSMKLLVNVVSTLQAIEQSPTIQGFCGIGLGVAFLSIPLTILLFVLEYKGIIDGRFLLLLTMIRLSTSPSVPRWPRSHAPVYQSALTANTTFVG